jgi:hypothetical protein
MTRSQQTTQHYTPHATLAAIGLKISSLKLFDTVKEHVFIKLKTIRHTPVEKLHDAFIAILAGAHGLCEINTCLRSDESLQRAFGRSSYITKIIGLGHCQRSPLELKGFALYRVTFNS